MTRLKLRLVIDDKTSCQTARRFFYMGRVCIPDFCHFLQSEKIFFDSQIFSKRKQQFFSTNINKLTQLYTQSVTSYVSLDHPHRGARGTAQKRQAISPKPDQNRASAVRHCSKPISLSRMVKNLSLTGCSLLSSHQSE